MEALSHAVAFDQDEPLTVIIVPRCLPEAAGRCGKRRWKAWPADVRSTPASGHAGMASRLVVHGLVWPQAEVPLSGNGQR
jgi:hypothetical protein